MRKYFRKLFLITTLFSSLNSVAQNTSTYNDPVPTIDPSVLSQYTINPSYAVGFTKGIYNCNSAGDAEYIIPLTIPDGINGIKPTIAINYNSNMGVGLLGINWDISGISQISRTSRELIYDDSTSGVNLKEGTIGDRFRLDGQRLILATGTYGLAGSTYRIENDNQTKITYIVRATQSLANAYFLVERTDGKIYEYGSNAQSKLMIGSKNYSWYINRIYDRNLNAIEFFYTFDSKTNELLINSIKYTGTLDQSMDPVNDNGTKSAVVSGSYSVNFVYVNYSDIYSQTYKLGSVFNQTKFIKQINIKAGATTVKSYVLDYAVNLTDATKHVRLVKVQETDGGSSLLHPININWDAKPSSITELVADSIRKDFFIMVTDVNADGITDVISANSAIPQSSTSAKQEINIHFGKPDNSSLDAPKIKSTLGASYDSYSSVPHEGLSHQIVDFDNDGLSDILLEHKTNVAQGARAFSVHTSTGSQLRTDASNLFEVKWLHYYVGTGRMKDKYYGSNSIMGDDIFVFDRAVNTQRGYGHNWKVYINGGRDTASNFTTQSLYNIKSCNIVDLNNDGVSEFVVINSLGTGVDQVSIFNLEKDIPKYKLVLKKQFFINSFYDRSFFADFNGDGLTDLLTNLSTGSTWNYYENNGTFKLGSLTTPIFAGMQTLSLTFNVNTPANSKIFIQDFNGDGAKDLGVLNNNPTSAHFYVGSVKDIFSSSIGQKSVPLIVNQQVSTGSELELNFCAAGDFNGDKQSDILVFIKSTQKFKFVYMHPNRLSSELVKSIVDSERKRINFMYSSFQKETYLNFVNNSSNSLRRTSPSKYFLTKILVDDKSTVIDKMEFDFQIPAWNRYGKGFLGFVNVIRLENNIIANQSKQFINSASLLAPGTIKYYTTKNNNLEQDVLLTEIAHTAQIANPFRKLNMVNITIKETKDFVKNISIRELSTYTYFGTDSTRTELYYQLANFSSASFYKKSEFIYNYISIPSIYLKQLSVLEERNSIKTNPSEIEKCSLIYNSKGLIIQKLNYINNQLITTNTISYDVKGRVLSIRETNASTNVARIETINSYDISGRYPRKVTNAIGLITTNDEYDVWGNVKKFIDNNGLITNNYYNSFGSIIKTELPLPNQEINYNYAWQSSYTDGKLYSVEMTQTSKPNSISYFDILGRKTFEGTHNDKNEYVFVKTNYNNILKNISSVSEPYLESQSASLFTNYEYFLSGLSFGKLRIINSPRANIEYTYSGNNVTQKETSTSPQKTTIKSYNVDGTLASVKNSLGEELVYSYFLNSKVKNVSSAGVITNTYQYDTRGFLQSEISANHGTIQYSYNNFAELISKTDAKGNVFIFVYDLMGRLINKNNSTQGTTTYVYDNGLNAKGKLVSISNNLNGQVSRFGYDDYGRIIINEYTFDNNIYSRHFEYSEDGNLQTISYPNNFKLLYGYNGNGYLQSIHDYNSGDKIWYKTAMNTRFQITDAHFGNNIPDNREYDNLGTLTRINMGSALDISYNFNLSTGNLMARTDNIKNFNETFTYDNLDRLIRVDNNYGMPMQSVVYNSQGNITEKTDIGNYVYHTTKINAVERINNFGTAIPIMQQDVSYNELNKPINISENNKTIDILYGLNDNRIFTTYTSNGNSTTKLSLGDYEVIEQNGKIVEKCYVYSPTGLIAINTKLLSKNTSSTVFVHKDHLGSLMAFSTSDQTIVDKRKYDAWGRSQNPDDGTYEDISIFDNTDRGYTGHEHYQDFGIINMNGRIYDPAIGRFFSPDPFIQDPENLQSFNQYSYVYNNPLKYTDPSGYLSAAYSNYNDYYNDDLYFIDPNTGERVNRNFTNDEMVDQSMTAYYNRKENDALLTYAVYKTGGFVSGEEPVIRAYSTAWLKAQNKGIGTEILDGFQTGLDIVGLIPGVGELADGLNALIYTGRGDYVNAGLSAAAMMPLAGMAATVGKLGNKALKLSDTKVALKKVHEILGGSLAKGDYGKFGSPQRGTPLKGYRLDPAHPGRPVGHPESVPHINYWDYTNGKRGSGGISGAIPIVKP
jgi:RHS repeat-associated protein